MTIVLMCLAFFLGTLALVATIKACDWRDRAQWAESRLRVYVFAEMDRRASSTQQRAFMPHMNQANRLDIN